jgi:isoleucyl-tRNA synthetase
VRNTLRFLLGNLPDFQPGQHEVAYAQLPSMDRYMLARLAAVLEEVQQGYDNFQFYRWARGGQGGGRGSGAARLRTR